MIRKILALAVLALLTVPAAVARPAVPAAKAVAALDTAVNRQDIGQLQRLLTEDFLQAGLTDSIFAGPITRQHFIESILHMHGTFAHLSRSSRTLSETANELTLAVAWSGVHSGAPFMTVAPSGRQVNWSSLEVWTRDDSGTFTHLETKMDQLELLRMLTDPRPDAAPVDPLSARTLASFPPGTFLESVVADADGALFVTKLFSGEIYEVAPDGKTTLAVSLDIGASPESMSGVMCLAWADRASFYATVLSRDPAVNGVWHIPLKGSARHVAALPSGSVPNGIGIDSRGMVYVADSELATIWRVDPKSGSAISWYHGEEVSKRTYIGRYPGANGLQVKHGFVYVANSDRARLSRIAILDNGSAGPVEVVADGLPGDDFAVATDGTVYVTTHPFNTVVRVSPDGTRTVIASLEQGVIGPTAAAIVGDGNQQKLAVVTDGGLYAPVAGQALAPAVILLNLP